MTIKELTPVLAKAAERLRTARTTATVCAPLVDLLPAGDVVAAYTVQDVNTDLWLAQGRRLVGRKIGLTSHAVQKQLGVDQPDYGMLFSDMSYADSEPIDLRRMLQPRVEAEIAFVLERDLDREGLTLVDVIGAVAYALPAIEVVDSAIRDWKISLVDTVADNASSGNYVLGTTPRSISSFDLRLCGMALERRGEVVSTGVGAACLGNPLTSVLWLAKKMLEVGRPLHAGDVVLSGALGPMVPVVAGDVVEARIHGLGEVRAEFQEGER